MHYALNDNWRRLMLTEQGITKIIVNYHPN